MKLFKRVFKKAVIMTLLLVCCAMVLNGCGNKNVDSKGNELTELSSDVSGNDSNGTHADASTSVTASTSAEDPEKVSDEATEVESENAVSKHLAFVYEGHTIAIFDAADDLKIEDLLGKADEIKSHTYSKDDGLNMDQLEGKTEKQYIYPGLVIKTIDTAEGKKPFIFSIEITDQKYPTVRNIKVGDSFEKLIEAYPEGNLLGGELSDAEDDFRYEPVNYVDVINFHIKGKKVESISMYTLLD